MKRLIALLAAGLLLAAVSSYAADLKITGDAYVRGTATKNLGDDNTGHTDAAKNFYDMEFHIFPVIQIEKNTKIVSKFTVDFDQVPDKSSSTTWAKDYAMKYSDGVSDGPALTIENLYISHLFESTGTEIVTGLFTGGAWATNFANTQYDAFRVRINQKVPYGTVLAYVQKNKEKHAWTDNNTFTDEGSEKDDSNSYTIAALLNIGGINVKPYICYTRMGVNKASSETGPKFTSDNINVKFASDSKFGIFGFEQDFELTHVNNPVVRNSNNISTKGKDFDIWGFYLNLYAEAVKNVTVGGKFAYASYDKSTNSYFEFGDDFDATLAIDDYMFTNGSKAMALFQAYTDIKLMEQLTVGTSFSYFTSVVRGSADRHYVTDDFGRHWGKDSDAWEIDLYGTYNITKYLSYSAAAGYAKVYDLYDGGGGKYNASGAYRIFHKLSMKF